jgi:predicted metal-binding membrane protein
VGDWGTAGHGLATADVRALQRQGQLAVPERAEAGDTAQLPLAALPAYGLAWLAGRLVGGHRAGATVLAVAIFAACGVYQLTPVKGRCLARCRSPLGLVLKLGSYHGRA